MTLATIKRSTWWHLIMGSDIDLQAPRYLLLSPLVMRKVKVSEMS